MQPRLSFAKRSVPKKCFKKGIFVRVSLWMPNWILIILVHKRGIHDKHTITLNDV